MVCEAEGINYMEKAMMKMQDRSLKTGLERKGIKKVALECSIHEENMNKADYFFKDEVIALILYLKRE